MTRFILALDQGTTSSRAIVFRDDATVAGVGQREFGQLFPQPGWVEHDPEAIWRSQLEAAREAIASARVAPGGIAALGIANQRETVVLWERATLRPLANAIVWQDRRTAEACERLRADGLEGLIRARTGLVIDAYFSGTKLAWLLDHLPGARERAEGGELAAGTIDAWLIARLTNGAVHATDRTNASRWMVFDIDRGAWDAELLAALRIPEAVLPEVRPSAGDFGRCAPEYLGAALPIAGVAGDQQAALFGQVCVRPGMAKNTYGTGCFLLLVTDGRPRAETAGLITTLTAVPPGGDAGYALEGSIFVAGAAVQWLRDGLGLIRTAAESEPVARSVPSSDGVYVVPAFVGLGAPHWDMYARGTIVGLTRGAGRAHLVRATLESIAYQTRDVVEAMEQVSGVALAELRVDGGAATNDLLMQMQADILGRTVVRPAVTETTALGAAALAGLAAGVWPSLPEGEPGYALEGSIFVAGAAVQWLRDGLGVIRTAAESEAVARSVPSSEGVYVVPAFTGLGAPHWDMYARGTIVGLTRGTGRAHVVRATLESIAYQTRDVVEAMERASGVALAELRVDGGAAANDLLMQVQADILGRPVVRPAVTETTALGAAALAGLTTAVWRSLPELEAHWRVDRRFEPALPAAEREAAHRGWRRAVERARGWLDG